VEVSFLKKRKGVSEVAFLKEKRREGPFLGVSAERNVVWSLLTGVLGVKRAGEVEGKRG
jgi:hypothetical protein